MIQVGASKILFTPPTEKAFENLNFSGLIEHWKTKGFKNIIAMVGAGVSTSAGIPDFRSPHCGLYHSLEEYKLPNPEAIFSLDYFINKPKPFYRVAKELLPGRHKPTAVHYFVRLLHEKGLLLRHYTQNIDDLELIAGVPADKLMQAHGSFNTSHCLKCRKSFSLDWLKRKLFNENKVPFCDVCSGLVKPDIVFYNELVPKSILASARSDFRKCDLLIIMGTSLTVYPFAELLGYVGPHCVRLLINNERVYGGENYGLLYDKPNNMRDVAYIGNCDNGVKILTDELGWGEQLRMMMKIT